MDSVVDRRLFLTSLSATGTLPTLAIAQASQQQYDYRRVIVAVYHMPKRRRGGFCPGCLLLDEALPSIMQRFPDVWFGISRDGRTPDSITTFNGEFHKYTSQRPAPIGCYPWIQIYAGTPGDWGFERYLMTGYRKGDDEKLETMISWAAEI